DSCRLIAVNLYSFVKNPFTPQAQFDFDHFYQVVYESQHLMDNLVDLELEAIERILEKIDQDPEPQFIKQVEIDTWKLLYEYGKRGRRTGLGFTALADMLAAMGLEFDSKEAMKVVDEVMRTKLMGEFDSSIDMAIERGPFEDFDPKIENTCELVPRLEYEFLGLCKRLMKYGRCSISISTVAPRETLGMLAQTSSVLEPAFFRSYNRR